MTSIVELFPKCRKLAYDARQRLALLSSNASSTSSTGELQLVLEELNRQLDMMEELVLRETPSQRTVWKHKIAELRQESATIMQQSTSIASSTNRSSRYSNNNGSSSTSYQSERDELMFRRRRRLNDTNNPEGDLQTLASESQSLANSNTMVLDILQSGTQSYQELKEQRQRLRGVTRIVADIGNSLGLSQATMRIIERRDITDAYFVAAGMVITLIVLYLTWF